jgi:hypothetical protein
MLSQIVDYTIILLLGFYFFYHWLGQGLVLSNAGLDILGYHDLMHVAHVSY